MTRIKQPEQQYQNMRMTSYYWLMVVSRKFGHVFSEKLRKPTREFAGTAKQLETGKAYESMTFQRKIYY
jgi:hypothetical protein